VDVHVVRLERLAGSKVEVARHLWIIAAPSLMMMSVRVLNRKREEEGHAHLVDEDVAVDLAALALLLLQVLAEALTSALRTKRKRKQACQTNAGVV
jgi:hypothetical protein